MSESDCCQYPGETQVAEEAPRSTGTTVCLAAKTLHCPRGGGAVWIYLNWALALRALGCRVIWLERPGRNDSSEEVRVNLAALKSHLAPFDLDSSIALVGEQQSVDSLESTESEPFLNLDAASEADLLLNLGYEQSTEIVSRFRRSAFIDIDPGLTQIWIATGSIQAPRHDIYFTIGETVGDRSALFPDCGLQWHYIRPPVYLPAWPIAKHRGAATFTTVSSWWSGWVTYEHEDYCNTKREGFLPFLRLPRQTSTTLELAISEGTGSHSERAMWEEHSWRVSEAELVAGTPDDYRRYIQESYGEFSCAKPSCLRLQNAWISDRTLCYLASGKPAVVQHTGQSGFLPDAAGLFRFRDLDEAVRYLDAVENDYDRHCRLARALAEEHFDARTVVKGVLERALA